MPIEPLRNQLQAALAGRYEIEREIGRGGMATVYLARDPRHERSVALKVLDPELGAVLGGERFLSEIRVTANLQHPNLLPLFDSGSAEGLLFYVMPFVEGETLRARLERERQLPVDEAVRITTAVANALDYAHARGVIHRDLKPENILLQHGQPVVADFGIALAVSNAGGQRVTQTGLSLGTPQYMSPEQATADRVIDGRTDIYSLGAVCYEMLVGEAPHTGATAQAVVAKLMTEEPRPLTVLRKAVPPHVDAAVRRALEKLPADRFATGKEFAAALADTTYVSRAMARADRPRRSPVSRAFAIVPWLIAGGVAAYAWKASRVAPSESVRFTVEPPDGLSFVDAIPTESFSIAPDGQSVAFIAGPRHTVFLRRFDRLEPTTVPGVERPVSMQFSEDGKWIAYTGPGSLNKARVDAGEATAPTVLVDSVNGVFVSWRRGSQIVFTRDASRLWRVPAGGGPAAVFATNDSSATRSWLTPMILSDEKTVVFRVTPRVGLPGTAADRLGVVSIDGGPATVVDLEMQNVLGYVEGFLIYGSRDGRIMGVRFDLSSRTVRGDPVSLFENVVVKRFSGVAASLADNGTMAYMTGAATTRVDLVDERGATIAAIPTEARSYVSLAWSPDGGSLLLQSGPFGSSDLWAYDVTTRVTTRLTQTGDVQTPHWTPDGKAITFTGIRKGKDSQNVPMSIPADGSAPAAPIESGIRAGIHFARGITADGKYLLGSKPAAGQSSYSYFAVPLAGTGAAIPLLTGVNRAGDLAPSPDSKWIAYASLESGRREVYVRPFPNGAGRLQVSSNGGSNPQWSRDGHRLFYRGPGAFFVATLEVGAGLPRLVRTDSLFPDVDRNDYSIHPDGRRIAVLRQAGGGVKLVVITNWLQGALAALRQR